MQDGFAEVDWNLVRSFTAVVQAGSLSGAAKSLGLAHPTVARHIQNLEAQLGVSLFERTGHGLTINASGQALVQSAEAMRAGALAFASSTAGLSDAPPGRIRVAVPESLAVMFPSLGHDIFARWCEETGSVDALVTDHEVNLLEHEADVAVCFGRPRHADLVARELGSVEFGLFASTAYLQEHPAVDNDWRAHQLVDDLDDRLRKFLVARGCFLHDTTTSFRSNTLGSRKRAMDACWGIGALPLVYLESFRDDVVSGTVETQNDLNVGSGVNAGNGALQQEARSVPQLQRVFADSFLETIGVWVCARPEIRNSPRQYELFRSLGETIKRRFATALAVSQQRRTLSQSLA